MNGSIIIPAYNEEKRILRTLFSIREELENSSLSYEIIVVDDGSKDDTAKIVKRTAKEFERLSLLSLPQNSGKGKAVQEGMLLAKGEWKLFMDADGSTRAKELPGLLKFLGDEHDIVIGSRRIRGATIEVPQPTHRKFLSWSFRTLVHTLLPVGVIDTQNGFKLFSKRASEMLFKEQFSTGWAFDVEILARARKHNLKIKEVPIHWRNDDRSKMTMKGAFRMLREIMVIRKKVR